MLRLQNIMCVLAVVHTLTDAAENATCIISGDPHYKTFDDLMLTYEGLCKHIIVNSTDDAPQQFEVYMRNEKRDVTPVAYAHYVDVYYNGITIRLNRNSQDNPVTVSVFVAKGRPPLDMMNAGFKVGLPFNARNMTVTYSSPFLSLKTNFGLLVRYDGTHIVRVTIPSSFMDKVIGMCGDYDNNTENDLVTRDGQSMDGVENGHSKIGDSYVVPDPENTDNSTCETVDIHPIPTCNPDLEQFYNDTCSQLLDTNGPLKDCIAVVGLPVSQEYYDTCMFDACATSAYRSICRTFDAFLQLCPSIVIPKITRKLGCSSWLCTVSGDPHYSTFDQIMLDYQGTCKHLLINSTSPSVPQFSIYIRNELRSSPYVSYVKYLEFVFSNVTYRIQRTGPGQVDVYRASGQPPHEMSAVGTKMPLPLNEANMKIAWIGVLLQITTSYGPLVQYDAQQTVKVTMPSRYIGKVQGVCGNLDLNDTNDLTTADGEDVGGQENAYSKVGNSFVVPNDPEVTDSSSCEVEDFNPIPSCDSEKKPHYTQVCSQLTNLTGMFNVCHSYFGINMTKDFYNNCLYDACATYDYSSICSTFESYLQICGQVVKNWRETFGCVSETTGQTTGQTEQPISTPEPLKQLVAP